MTALPATRRVILGALAFQAVMGLALFANDLASGIGGLGRLALPSAAPRLDRPVSPGDQVRRYRPDRLPPRPGTSPLPVDAAMPESLRLQTANEGGATVISLRGAIAPGDAPRILGRIETLGLTPDLVRLDSPGGSVADALELGRALRQGGARTEVADGAVCLSACPYILAAGTERRVHPGALVGVHQHTFGESTVLPAFLAVEDIQRGQGLVLGYLVEMGIDPRLMEPALLTPPGEIYLLLPEELLDYRLVTPPEG